MSSTSTGIRPYQQWLAESRTVKARGDAGEYMSWYMKNPSPASVPADATARERLARAAAATATHFTGKQVSVRYTADDATGCRWILTGEILGTGFIDAGNASKDAIMIRNEHGVICAVAVGDVSDIENA